MSEEHENLDLTEDAPFDFNALVAEVESRDWDSDDVLDDEDGPDQEAGELSEDDLDASDHDDEDYEDSEDSEAEAEDEAPAEDDDAEAEQDQETEESAPEAEAKADPRDDEIARLKDLVLQSQQQAQQVMQVLLQRQNQAKAPKQEAPAQPGLDPDLAHMFLFDPNPEKLKNLDPTLKAKGTEFASKWTKDTARYAVDPAAFYQEKIREQVLKDVQEIVGPTLRQQKMQAAKAVVDQHLDGLDDGAQQRVLQVFKDLGTNTPEALKFASDFVRKEIQEQKLAERERKIETAERQKQANKRSGKKRGSRRSGRRARDNKQPRLRDNESLDQFYRRVLNQEE